MKNNFRKFGVIALAIGFLALPSLGCRKKKDTLVNIYVKNASNQLVAGATVVLTAEPSEGQNGAILDEWGEFNTQTNSSGMATFNFNEIYELGQAGVAVANVKATKDGSTGYGVVKVEQETTSEETVFL